MPIKFAKNITAKFILSIALVLMLSCNFVNVTVTNSKPKTTATPTEVLAEIIFPTATIEQVVEVMPTETKALPTLTIEPTRTQSPVKKTATRTKPAPTVTSIAPVMQATQAIVPPTSTVDTGSITVTAATGNLFVRRGPGTKYSIVGGFSKGVTTKAVGRNEKKDWLAIEIPLTKGVIGWISMGTGYTDMSASIDLLPLYPYDEAKPAYIKNCTLHDMTTRPGQWNLPAKTTQQVNPGEYAILDMSTGQSKVMEMILKEGNTGIIKVDGDGVSHPCP